MQNIDVKIEQWKKRLLDIGKRNRLINFRETKRSNISIISPSYDVLYEKLVQKEEELVFPYPLKVTYDENDDENNENNMAILEGNIKTNRSISEQQKTLKALRARAKTSMEEQGVNILYLTFGLIKWKETDDSDIVITSPIVLVPVSLTIESINDPFILQIHEDEIVVNPSLSFKFENDFGITLPEFDGHEDSISDYLSNITKIAKKRNWEVLTEVNLSLLSFLKINMYKDLDDNRDKIVSNPIIKALSGDLSEIERLPTELENYDHDINTKPIDMYQVVDADSSQQDAILLSKKGVSFVLQGPPGTGKSQTITNIIAEAIADGKKVLFVSEKMAALEVVKKRLNQSGLEDFCLTLHSHKANKKDILNQLGKTLSIKKIQVQEEAIYKLTKLKERRNKLNEYHKQLHTPCMPLNKTIYQVNGELANLSDTEDIIFEINDVANTDMELFNKYKFLLDEFSKTVGKLSEDYIENPWYGCNVPAVTHELRHNIDVNLNKLLPDLKALLSNFESVKNHYNLNMPATLENVQQLCRMLDVWSKCPIIPERWLDADLEKLSEEANVYIELFDEYVIKRTKLLNKYNTDVLSLSANEIISLIEANMSSVKKYLNEKNYAASKEIITFADKIIKNSYDIDTTLRDILNKSNIISNISGIDFRENISSILDLLPLIELILKNPKPTGYWFDNSKFLSVNTLFNEAQEIHMQLLSKIQHIKGVYEESILDIDYDNMLKKFKNEYVPIFKTVANSENDYNISYSKLKSFIYNQVDELKMLFGLISKAQESAKITTEMLGLKGCSSLNSILELNTLIKALLENPRPTESWFDPNKTNLIDKLINDIKTIQQEIAAETEFVLTKYNKDILDIDCKQMLFRFNTEYTSIFKIFKGNYRADKKMLKGLSKDPNNKITDGDIITLLNKLIVIREKDQWLNDNKKFADDLLGSLYAEKYTDWSVVDKSRKNFSVIRNYFGSGLISNKVKAFLLKNDNSQLENHFIYLSKIANDDVVTRISNILGKSIENLNIDMIMEKIQNIIELSVEIEREYKKISNLLKNKSKADDLAQNNIVDTLEQIQIVYEKRRWIKMHIEELKLSFGQHYVGEDTNWENIKQSFAVVKEIGRYFKEKSVPGKLKEMLISGNIIYDSLIDAKNSFEKVETTNIIGTLNELLNFQNNDNIKIDDLLSIISEIKTEVAIAQTAYQKFLDCAKGREQFDDIMTDILLLERIQFIEGTINKNKDMLHESYQFMFKGITTDWRHIQASLNWTCEFREISKKYLLSSENMKEICSNLDIVHWAGEKNKEISEQKKKLDDNFNWFSSLFDNGVILYGTDLYRIIDRIEKSLTNLALLEEWIDFRSIREQCRDAGLSDYIEKVEQVRMQTHVIVNTFLKRFYRLWLDAIILKYPAVYSFRRRTQDSLIEEFKELDLMQLNIARSRIKERLIERLPDTNIATAAVDEVGILRRELLKQRKIMPLRRLFKSIPNLLTALKPCLMMSPLSVSLFLQAGGYNFDMIIFDEASQIYTEDAIGAIMRGKQVIIAGDSKQLPPTSFFASTLSDGDFDTDDEDEYDDTDAYDSILEEALNAIPERTLKWHYRSRHEHLIAFSNAKIYNHNLITFPSNIEKAPDNGVEYIYVPDGVYERGGKKQNINEAKRVAGLVFEHFKKYPDRSLGVVTFSEAQQQAVENAITHLRLQKPQFEKFFSEDAEEAFFVKNLENVQGDERDTIIFSIGYAKDPNGVMYMNFGPLSRNGGYRRLNVAITRAKFNVKLVGSIHPTDINLEKTNAEGVKMLRSYIEFAINGASAIQNELAYSETVNVESPFEEAVYDFLVNSGYNVATQVGCSGYRIDLAVKHPTLNGRFVLGIECDGATYHSARTARERDRLRQTILEDIGWKIYRIWSTDWIKDPITEGSNLLEAIKMAIANYKENDSYQSSKKEIDDELNIETVISRISDEDHAKNPYGFKHYKEANIWEVKRIPNDIDYLKEVVAHIVNVEYPIHFENLCKRLTPLFGNQKATVRVRNWVNDAMHGLEGKRIYKLGEFIYPINAQDIPVRVPIGNKNIRPINYISTEEIAKAMQSIISKSFGIAPEDLLVITAREFGFNRTGNNIITAMQKAYNFLIKENKIKVVDDKVVLEG